ncbi:hypothetical protein [Psychrobacter sp. AOP7-B1-24]|uniref:hypothetical protein n=1 Tax=Psychrobacter sp. AOP7-B1-24 TaxID=3457645 RepID=UPI00402BD3FB
MKHWQSVSMKKNRFNASKKVFAQFNISYMVVFGSALFLITACNIDKASEDLSPIEAQSTITLDSNIKEAENVKESIKNSYARLASERPDVCPKLIQKGVDSQVIKRTAEVMTSDYCDYFLYPQDGQKISVKVNDRQIETLLIVPILHNFANGDYQVESYDKHVIRLAYDGATYKPENLVYDVAVTVSD